MNYLGLVLPENPMSDLPFQYQATPSWFIVSHFPPACFSFAALYSSLYINFIHYWDYKRSREQSRDRVLEWLEQLWTFVSTLFKRSALLPWTIVSVTDDQHSFRDFYTSNIQPCVAGSSETSYDVESAQVGPCKDRLDRVDLGLQVCQVVENFGRYVKYVVTSTVSDTNGIPGKAISANAFEVLMCSALSL